MKDFSKRGTGTDLHFKNSGPGCSCDKEMGGGKSKSLWGAHRGAVVIFQPKGKWPGLGWWARQPEGEALNLAPQRRDLLLDF